MRLLILNVRKILKKIVYAIRLMIPCSILVGDHLDHLYIYDAVQDTGYKKKIQIAKNVKFSKLSDILQMIRHACTHPWQY